MYWSRAHRHVRIRFEGGSDHFFFRFLITGARRVKLSVAEDRDVGQKRPEYAAIENVHELLQLHLEQGDDAPPILVRAKPGTGKTWTSRQLVRSLAVDPRQRALPCDERLVPLLIFVQKLSHELRGESQKSGVQTSTIFASTGLIEQHIRTKFADWPETLAMLLHLLLRRQLLIVIDGVDEAADLSRSIEEFVLKQLVAEGHRVVVTSRYEGVRVDLYEDFCIMDLKPLSDEQQRSVIHTQLGDNEYFDHLLSFSKIRSEHDRIYREDAFPSAEDREFLETSCAPDRFRLDDGAFDPEMVQKSLELADLQRSAGEPRSTILREHCSVLTPSALQRVDVSATTCFDAAQPTVDATAGLPVDIAATMCFCAPQPVDATADLPEKSQKLVSDLSKLANKRNTDAAELWPVIVSSTDELLLAAETLRPVFEIGMRALLAEAGLTDEALIVGPLKDPVRIYEKALDDYSGRFGASILPEACVVDVLRTRLVCRSGSAYSATQRTLEDGLVFDVGDGTTARLELVRSKNKYRSTDPTHFR